MERELEKTLMEIECSIKSHEQRGNTHAQSVLEQARDIIAICAEATRTPSGLRKMLRRDTADGWIPVEDRLPEDDVRVLVTYADIDDEQYTDIAITTYGYAYLGGNKLDFKEWRSPFEYFRSNYKVIAWRPLPEPYCPKKESEGSRRLREREEFFKG